MKKIICGAEYDTAASTIVKKVTEGCFGDSCGYEETLYVTADGKYFLYTNPNSNFVKSANKRFMLISQEKAFVRCIF